jgi:ABC-type glutathione transport system ATPase component
MQLDLGSLRELYKSGRATPSDVIAAVYGKIASGPIGPVWITLVPREKSMARAWQQRVAIAQALINRPRILLMDEAFSALDSGTRREMQALVRELWKSTGTTVLFVTHNIDEALRLGIRVVVLACEAPEQGSRIALDLAVPDPCAENDIPPLVDRLECVSCPAEVGARIVLSL